MQERLQKIIARAGIASRRMAEQMILSGQVSVNGQVVTVLGTKADAESDSIKVGNRLVKAPEEKTYLALHKPPEVVATMSDPEGRETLKDFLAGLKGRVFPVGRLDYPTAGVILLTNDGDLANKLLEAGRRGGLAQVYWLKLKGMLSEDERSRAERESGARVRMVKPGENAWYEARVEDAARDRLRNWLFRAGHPVEKMRRVKYGPVELGRMEPGRYRMLVAEEIETLQKIARGERIIEKPEVLRPVPRAARQGPGARPTGRKEFRPRKFGPSQGKNGRPQRFAGPHRPAGPRRDGPPQGTGERPKQWGAPRKDWKKSASPRPGGARPGRPPFRDDRPAGKRTGRPGPPKFGGRPQDSKPGFAKRGNFRSRPRGKPGRKG